MLVRNAWRWMSENTEASMRVRRHQLNQVVGTAMTTETPCKAAQD